MVKGIVFDLDDTLYDYSILEPKAAEAVKEYAAEKLCIKKSVFDDVLREAKCAVKKQLHDSASGHNRLLYYQKVLELLNYTSVSEALVMEELYWSYMLEHMELREGAEELLEYCSRNGMKIGICTDLTAQIQLRKVQKLGLEKWLDCLVTSEEAGKEKPAPVMFQLCLDKMKLDSREVLFVGDSYERDVEGARKSGMNVVWLTEKPVRRMPEGCIQTADFEGVKEVLERGFI